MANNRRMAGSVLAALQLSLIGATAHAVPIEASMAVGELLALDGTLTLPGAGADQVDLFFLADNTASMAAFIGRTEELAQAIMAGVPTGLSYNFGVGAYFDDPSEGVAPEDAYRELTPLGSSIAAAESGIESWVAEGGGDPEGGLFALEQIALNTGWRNESQRILVWFGDGPSHTATTTLAEAIAALQSRSVQVVAFNEQTPGDGIDVDSHAAFLAAATDGSVTSRYPGFLPSDLSAIVNSEIITAFPTVDLLFNSNFVGSGLTVDVACVDSLGCNGVGRGESRDFRVSVNAHEAGVYEFAAGANGQFETYRITVADAVAIPEPSTFGLFALCLPLLGYVRLVGKRIVSGGCRRSTPPRGSPRG